MTSFGALSIEDLCNGMNDWRNIQEVVRAAFKIFYDNSILQSDRIRRLEADLESTRLELANAQATLRSETARCVQDLSQRIDTKIGRNEAQDGLDAKLAKTEFSSFVSSVNEEIARKADDHGVRSALDLKANIHDVNAALAEKANKQSIAQALHKKANRADVDEQLAQKADALETNAALARKADSEMINVVLASKATKSEMTSQIESKAQELSNSLSRDIQLRPTRSELDQKASTADVQSWMSTKVEKLDFQEALAHQSQRHESELRGKTAELQMLVSQKCDKAEFLEAFTNMNSRQQRMESESKVTVTELRKQLSDKVERQELSDALAGQAGKTSKLSQDMRSGLSELNKQGERHQRAVEDLLDLTRKSTIDLRAELERKADKSETALQLSLKADRAEMISILNTKADWDAVQKALSEGLAIKADIDAVNKVLEDRATVADLGKKADVNDVEELAKEVQLRSTIKDVCTLLDTKANIVEVNQALESVNRELDSKTPLEVFERNRSDQAALNAAMVSEQCVGRWIWKTGKTKAGHGVPWNMQTVNTDPDNFLWEKDKIHIIVIAPGLYEVSFGFFARKKPTVQLLVNGEPVLSALNTAAYVIHHSSGRLASTGPHSAGTITGLSHLDFLALPPNAKIAISYNGEEGAEGFISLKKL